MSTEPFDIADLVASLPMLLAALVAYFVPAIVAGLREHPHKLSIVGLNILLGWTVVGWISALIWALFDQRGEASR